MPKGRLYNPSTERDGLWVRDIAMYISYCMPVLALQNAERGLILIPARHGKEIWQESEFPHIDVTTKLPVTSAQDILQRGASSWTERRLPPIRAPCNKTEAQHGFPFSSHDNRHLIQWSGEYLDSGLGRRKTSHETRQQFSQNFNLSCHSTPPRPASYWDGFTNYHISYRGRQDTETPFCRRYPKHHPERSACIRDLPEDRFMWFGASTGLS